MEKEQRVNIFWEGNSISLLRHHRYKTDNQLKTNKKKINAKAATHTHICTPIKYTQYPDSSQGKIRFNTNQQVSAGRICEHYYIRLQSCAIST